MRNFLARYAPTILGGIVLAGFVIVSVVYIARSSITDLVETNMRSRAENFANYLESPEGHLETFLTGISRSPDEEAMVRRVANLSDIDGFSIFDSSGKEVFGTSSDRYEWLLRDRPGGLRSGDRLSSAVLKNNGTWPIVDYADTETPNVILPLHRGGETLGYVSVRGGKVDFLRHAFQSTLASTSVSLILVLLLATGLPLLIYLRRKQKIAAADEHIRFLARHDSLTSLLNRRTIQEESDALLSTVRATRERMAYLYIDVDDISEINDRFGQAAGDEVLRVIAQRLKEIADTRKDMVARIGPDDFAVLYRRLESEADVHALARKITRSVAEAIEINGEHVNPDVSIGCALVPTNGRSHSELVKHAEIAHQKHKIEKKSDVVFFEASMDAAVHRRRELDALIRSAIANDGFEVFFQPIIGNDGETLLGFEALVRMRDQNGDYVSPAEFIPVAESRGHVKAIGTFVLREATRQIAEWPEHLFVCVNLSTVQFADGDLLTIVQDALDKAGIDGRRLEIEVVESLLLERSEIVMEQLRALKQLGISIDMDDFGTGYSSLSYLWRFPFDKLKIDQSFMVAVHNNEPNVSQILEAIVSMAHYMKMKVTVEGVETQAQVELMRSLRCDQFQGYFFGKPMPADAIAGEVLTRFNCNKAGGAKTSLAQVDLREDDAHGLAVAGMGQNATEMAR